MRAILRNCLRNKGGRRFSGFLMPATACRRTLQDLIVPPPVINSDLQNSYPRFRRSSVRVKLGLRFFGSLESLQQFKSVVSFRELVQIPR